MTEYVNEDEDFEDEHLHATAHSTLLSILEVKNEPMGVAEAAQLEQGFMVSGDVLALLDRGEAMRGTGAVDQMSTAQWRDLTFGRGQLYDPSFGDEDDDNDYSMNGGF